MSEVAHNVQHDFWRPPAAPAASGMVEACDGCGTEFISGARFCHVCGSARQEQPAPVAINRWARYLEFQTIKEGLNLSTGSLVAFMVGLGCLLAVILVGVIYSMQNFAEFEAVQMYRMQWLLAAVAAFVAGILLKKTEQQ
jgi:hypothetical protein